MTISRLKYLINRGRAGRGWDLNVVSRNPKTHSLHYNKIFQNVFNPMVKLKKEQFCWGKKFSSTFLSSLADLIIKLTWGRSTRGKQKFNNMNTWERPKNWVTPQNDWTHHFKYHLQPKTKEDIGDGVFIMGGCQEKHSQQK